MTNKGSVYFAHGMESSPKSEKIVRLARVAEAQGYTVEVPDYSSTYDPDERVRMLLQQQPSGRLVLAGSSMGAYVSVAAAEVWQVQALFLMAPALHIPGYALQDPSPKARLISIVHGWQDDVIPVENSISFARRFHADLHLVDDGHRLANSIPLLELLFERLLERASQLPGQGASPG